MKNRLFIHKLYTNFRLVSNGIEHSTKTVLKILKAIPFTNDFNMINFKVVFWKYQLSSALVFWMWVSLVDARCLDHVRQLAGEEEAAGKADYCADNAEVALFNAIKLYVNERVYIQREGLGDVWVLTQTPFVMSIVVWLVAFFQKYTFLGGGMNSVIYFRKNGNLLICTNPSVGPTDGNSSRIKIKWMNQPLKSRKICMLAIFWNYFNSKS